MNARRLFPPGGPRYELFDTCTLIFVVGYLGYVVIEPAATQATLPPLRVVSEHTLGILLTSAGAIGVLTSYSRRFYKIGYTVAITAALAMCVNYSLGALESWQVRPVISAVFYGWMARRLMRDNGDGA